MDEPLVLDKIRSKPSFDLSTCPRVCWRETDKCSLGKIGVVVIPKMSGRVFVHPFCCYKPD
jgi:hypothetical protein